MQHWWNDTHGGKTGAVVEDSLPVVSCPPQIPHGPAWD